MSKSNYLEKIKENFPKIKFKKTKLITEGYDDDVIILDKKIVFSFPKNKLDCLNKFQKELKILPLLNKVISLPIPNFIYISRDKTFAGYKYISGAPFTRTIIEKMNEKEKIKCAKQIALFLYQLHNFPIDLLDKTNKNIKIKQKNKKLSLVHKDLIDEHILFDRKSKKISGIIDFGDLEVSTSEVDFKRLLYSYSKDFVQTIKGYYQDFEIKNKKHPN